MGRRQKLLLLLSGIAFSKIMVNSFEIPISSQVQIRPAPLIGGPKWLPIHCKVIVCSNVFDFVPLDATNPETLKRLATLQGVPAVARIQRRTSEEDNIIDDLGMVNRAVNFCLDYKKDIHLIRNNCWSFAFELISYVTMLEIEEE